MWLELEEKQWRPFKIGNHFYVSKGAYLSKKQILKGLNPYVTASASNNGLTDFIGNKALFSSNMITIEKVRLSAFYQPASFYCSHDVSVISHQKLNKLSGLFVCSMINRQGKKYSYGRQAQLNVVKRETAFLPVDLEGEPDWQFMQDSIKALMDKKKAKYIEFSRKESAALIPKNIVKLEDKEWHEFFIGGKEGIFNISSTSSGIDKNKLITSSDNELEKTIPYITRTNEQNGINLFIPESQQEKFKRDASGVITIGLDTQTVFYQPYEFFTGQNIQILHHNSLNKWNSLFLIPLLKIQMDKFNWGGNGATLGRLRRTKIMLPINENGTPDFEYMGQYMMNLEYRKRKQYIDYIQIEKRAYPSGTSYFALQTY